MEHARLTVTLRHSPGALARLAVTLNSQRVLGLTYDAAPANAARAVVQVVRPDAVRAQEKLRRLVDVIDVAVEHG
ncbi:hypothetical protein GCM10020367_49350 [Streptomyces sannanensis]|uniref:ACT domain-containing protein n=1 Tax=Streptomyces sannanensis TaxID=285536 RepID=A0ABP6SHS5_9ACTN